MLKLLTAMLLLLFTPASIAGGVVISVGSKHINADHELNEINPGIGHIVEMNRAIYKYAPDYATYGVYYNSRNKVSYYASAGYMVSKRLSFEVGPASGYGSVVRIGVIGVVHVGRARIIIVPPIPSLDIPLVFGLQIRI